MSYLHSLLKSLRSDLLEVTSSSLAVHIFLDRAECLRSLSGAKLLSRMRLITEGTRKGMWCQNRRFQLTRLETRTKAVSYTHLTLPTKA